jgi:Spy/CpxP family protein refolding chaperone
MNLSRLLDGSALLALVMMFLSSGDVVSQDKKDAKDPPKATKGQIPTGWGKLGLDAAQKQSIYAIQGEYKDKISKLEEEIKKLEAEKYKKMVGVLKPEQKKMLTEGLTPEPDPKPKTKEPAKDSK